MHPTEDSGEKGRSLNAVYRTGLGQSSRRFLSEDSSKPCVIGGIIFENVPGLDAESDGDVIFHALCNAISSLTHVPILSSIARELCRKGGITDSSVYLEKALETLGGEKIVHVSIALEGKRPFLEDKLLAMRTRIGQLLQIRESQVGITVTSGDGLTDFGCGDGLQAFAILTVASIRPLA